MNENQRIVFVKNLQHYMNLRGIDQSDIVSTLGYSASTVSDWVTGKKYPRVDSMQKLADYLGVLISDLTMESSILANTLDPVFGYDTPTARRLREIGEALVTTPSDPVERELIEIYRDLNDLGKQALMGTARGLAANPDMKKDGELNTGTA